MTSPQSETSATAPAMGRAEFVTLMAALMALTALAIDSMLPALQTIGAELGVKDPNRSQLVLTSFLIGLGIGSLVHGPLSDRFGRRPILLGALASYVVLAIVCGVAPTFDLLLAARFALGFSAASMGVLTISIIRDRFSGDDMAQLLSTTFTVFMIVPVIAPSVGQFILLFAHWRWIFLVLAAMGSVMLLWVWKRLPETMDPADAVPLQPKRLVREWGQIATHRSATPYMLASALAQGGLFGYLNSGPQIFADVFDAESFFPTAFAMVAVTMAATNYINSRIVQRFGARRVSHTALILYIAFAAMQLASALLFPESLPLFLVTLALNMSMIGLIGSNFGSIAMEPFGHVAGSASSFGSAVRTLVAATIGAYIGHIYNQTAAPMSLGFLVCGIASLLLVLFAEQGRLFTRPRTARPSDAALPRSG